jgi:glycosyltransferase involved in cell wall biosynthesis
MQSNASRVSFCIPTYESKGKAKRYLFDVFYALTFQTNKNFNVWISDHSVNDDVFEACQEYANEFEINYLRNEDQRGQISANTNCALRHADGEILKVMFQDDFILTKNLVEELDKAFVDGVDWAVTGFAHTVDDGQTHYNPKIPQYNDRLLEGVNTLSSPSILALRNGIDEYFDEKLTMLMDCDMYYRLYKYHGDPVVLPDYHISNREHRNQTQRTYEHLIPSEIDYLKEKHT